MSTLSLLLFVPLALLFMGINILIGCYVAIRIGYGPPNWQTALNLVVPLTTLQNCLNDGRDRLDEKIPRADRLLNWLNVPKPIVMVDTSPEETDVSEGFEEDEDSNDLPAEEFGDNPAGESLEIPQSVARIAYLSP